MKSQYEKHSGWLLIVGILVGVLAVTAGPALAALTFSGTSITGDSSITIDSSSTAALPTPSAPTVIPTGVDDGATWSYFVERRNAVGLSDPSPAGVTTDGANTLTMMNFNTITPPACVGTQVSTDVFRGDSSQRVRSGFIGNVSCGGSINDTGIAAYIDPNTPFTSGSPNLSNGLAVEGSLSVGGIVSVGDPTVIENRTTPSVQNVIATKSAKFGDTGIEFISDNTNFESAGPGLVFPFTNYDTNRTPPSIFVGETGMFATASGSFNDYLIMAGPEDNPTNLADFCSDNITFGTNCDYTPNNASAFLSFAIPNPTFAGLAITRNSAQTGDLFQLLDSDGATVLTTFDQNGSLAIGTSTPQAKLDVNGTTTILEQSLTPTHSTSTCTTGMEAWDANYDYRCVATNTWKRAPLSSW